MRNQNLLFAVPWLFALQSAWAEPVAGGCPAPGERLDLPMVVDARAVAERLAASLANPGAEFPGYHDRMEPDERALVDDHLGWSARYYEARHALIDGDLRTYREISSSLPGTREPSSLSWVRLTSLVRLAAIDVEFAAGGFSEAMIDKLLLAAKTADGPSSGSTVSDITGSSWVILSGETSRNDSRGFRADLDVAAFIARALAAMGAGDVAAIEVLGEEGRDRVARYGSDPCTHLDAARVAIILVRLLQELRVFRDDSRDVTAMLEAASDARQFASLLEYPIVWAAAHRASAAAYDQAAEAEPESWRAPRWRALAERSEALAFAASRLE